VGELKTGRNKRSFLCKIKVEKRFGNQRCSSIKIEKQRGLCKEKRFGEQEGYCKITLSKAKKAARIQKRKKVLWISVPPRRGVMR